MGRKHRFFVAGTDTGVGKTLVSSALLMAAKQRGMETLGVKPVAAGADQYADGQWLNDDALALQAQTTLPLQYMQINPVLLPVAASPHIAAAEQGKTLNAERITGFCRGVLSQPAEFAVVEGAGGWYVPLNSRETLADVAMTLQLPVILVVGMRLGCLNHALLTAKAIQQSGLVLAGWVANSVEPTMPYHNENITYLQQTLGGPLLADIPFDGMGNEAVANQQRCERVAKALTLSVLLDKY